MIDENDEQNKHSDLDYWDGLSEDEKIKELNLFTEQRRQESIQKYGRDIYDKESNIDEEGNKKVEHSKASKFRNIIDKIIDFYSLWRDPILVIIALIIGFIILAKVWMGM